MLENMGYWQNGLEFEKKVMLPYGVAAWIRVKPHASKNNSMRLFQLGNEICRVVCKIEKFCKNWNAHGDDSYPGTVLIN